jgi:hypothetical protein
LEGNNSALDVIRGQDHATNVVVMEDCLQEATLTKLETTRYSLSEIIGEAKFQHQIARDYQRFLTTCTDE